MDSQRNWQNLIMIRIAYKSLNIVKQIFTYWLWTVLSSLSQRHNCLTNCWEIKYSPGGPKDPATALSIQHWWPKGGVNSNESIERNKENELGKSMESSSQSVGNAACVSQAPDPRAHHYLAQVSWSVSTLTYSTYENSGVVCGLGLRESSQNDSQPIVDFYLVCLFLTSK